MLQKILVAMGDLPDSEQIFTVGLALAQKLDAELLLLHVLNPLVPHGLSTVDSPLVGGILPMINEVEIARYTAVCGLMGYIDLQKPDLGRGTGFQVSPMLLRTAVPTHGKNTNA